MREACSHFKLSDFVRLGEAYHFARTDLTADNIARLHDHDYHEMFWVLRGRGDHRLNGRSSPLQAGVVQLIRPQDRHRVTGSAEAPLRIVNVAFSSQAWRDLHMRYFAPAVDWFELPEAQRCWRMEPRVQALLSHWAERLADPSRPRVALDGFLMDLPHFRPGLAGPNQVPVPDWLARAVQEIARPEHLVGGTLALARLAGRTPSHVARATVRWLHQTPTDIVNAARMDYAARQLAETARPIIDIMFDCGLSNLSHFYALFRRRFGISPRRYRLRALPTVRG